MVLACSAACHAGAPRIRLLAILAMLSAALALGEDGYLYKWLRALVPQFGFLRFPIKFQLFDELYRADTWRRTRRTRVHTPVMYHTTGGEIK